MNIAFDLDGVICHRKTELGGSEKYLTCYPDQDVVDVVNRLFDEGNYIIIYTARGMNTFNNDVRKVYDGLYELTKNQLIKWGVKHHELVMGKVSYDVLIDDKALNAINAQTAKDIKHFLSNNGQ